MYVGIISFCNRIATNIKSVNVKDEILKDLENFNIKIIQKHYHNIRENTIDVNLKHILGTPHLMCMRTNGNPYFLYFTRYDEIDIVYFIDKKIHPTYQRPRIILARGFFDTSIFDGTLIDGEMVKVGTSDWKFIMNDIIAYKGEHLHSKNLIQRLTILYNMLETEYYPDEHVDVCSFEIKKYWHCTSENLKKINSIASTMEYSIRGIYFWAFNLKFKPKLINFDNSVLTNVYIKTKTNPEFISTTPPHPTTENTNDIGSENNKSTTLIPHPPPIPHPSQQSSIIKWIQKTDMPDVFNVYDKKVDILNINDDISKLQTLKTINNNSHIFSIAYIKDIKTSHMMQRVFQNLNSKTLIKFECIFNSFKNKYEPIVPIYDD
jgi:hypothetical protein